MGVLIFFKIKQISCYNKTIKHNQMKKNEIKI